MKTRILNQSREGLEATLLITSLVFALVLL